jgi:Skp family chaperone for outer membrane proteins
MKTEITLEQFQSIISKYENEASKLQNMIDEWDSSQDEECNPKKQEEQSKIVDKAYNQVTKYAKKLNYEG